LAFVSDRVEKSGLFLMPLDGGEPREVTRYHEPIADVAWSPDGSRIAFTAFVDPTDPNGERPKDGPAAVRVTRRVDYKQDGFGYLGDRRHQVFVVDIATGARRTLTCAPYNHSSPQWSRDGQRVLYRCATNNGMSGQLFVQALDGDASPTPITADGWVVTTWAWSPDGLRVLFSGEPERTGQTDWYIYDLAGGYTRQITDDQPCLPDGGFAPLLPPAQPAWDGSAAVFHGFARGRSGTWRLDTDTGSLREIETEDELRVGFSVDASGRFAVQAAGSLRSFGEVVVVDLAEGRRTIVTALSRHVLDAQPPARWERFDIVRDGFTIEAWLLLPPDFDPTKSYPLVLDVHGGPQAYYGHGFTPYQQALASAGFAVVYANPRGSASYGREFVRQVLGDWGGEDYLDLMAVVDEALKRPYLDPARTGIWGYSYGGYMTAWTIARNHRFKAAVCGAPCFDLESMYGTSDISHFFGVSNWTDKPWNAREWYATHSPSQFAHNTRTPTLIIQGEADERCPVGQGEQMFVTLNQAGCEVEFARYPGGFHGFMRAGPPEHRRDALERIVAWFQRHLG
jgi:dipeptidyl aminopeptidase/acylaminoacyl peptidase